MNENEAVMIGGVCDGGTCVAEAPYRVGQRVKNDCFFHICNADDEVQFERSHYRLEWFRSGSRRFPLYIENSLSHEDAMERLITRYAAG